MCSSCTAGPIQCIEPLLTIFEEVKLVINESVSDALIETAMRTARVLLLDQEVSISAIQRIHKAIFQRLHA